MTKGLPFQGGDLIFSVSEGMEKEMIYHAYIGSSVIFFAIHESIPIIVHVLE